ncbi:MAG: hypothetical protein LH617_09600 [Ramlibacter sp.]|nr:hypothetical protein [Ramlibacter sp.]
MAKEGGQLSTRALACSRAWVLRAQPNPGWCRLLFDDERPPHITFLLAGRRAFLGLDRDGLLRNGASPSLPADDLDAIDRLKPDADVGTCCAAAATGEVVETPQGRVLGTFGSYFRQIRHPTERERDALARLMPVAAQAITARASMPAPE